MRRKILVALAAVALGLGLSASRADAHTYDSYSYWYGGASRPYSDMVVYHSKPVDLTPGYVHYYVYARNSDRRHEFQWWLRVNVDTGNWAMESGYQDCGLIFCREP